MSVQFVGEIAVFAKSTFERFGQVLALTAHPVGQYGGQVGAACRDLFHSHREVAQRDVVQIVRYGCAIVTCAAVFPCQ